MDRKMKISPEGILERFSTPRDEFELWNEELSTPQVSDALKNLVDHPWVIPGVKPLKDEFKIIGRAITVKTSSYDWGTALKAMDIAQKGDVLVICSEDDDAEEYGKYETYQEDNAVWGELTSKTAQENGLTATVVYGAVRDTAAVKNLNYPVFTRSIVPNAGEPLGKGKVNVTLECGGVVINPQDIIIGDDCGVIVVPAELSGKVLKKALNIKRGESELIRKIQEGWSLSEILE